MQLFPRPAGLCLFGLLLLSGAAAREGLSPITRIVELLKELTTQVEKDHKTEEGLYETFVCWAQSMISQKTKSNSEAQSRVDMLQGYIADLDAGRIELTTERSDLTKQIENLNVDMEVASQVRDTEHTDFNLAKDEMQKGIDALTKAIDVLNTATKDHKEGVLLNIKSDAGFTARAKEAVALSDAVALGEKVLTKGDALFLRRLLTGEVPHADWKKLNRKATFKMDYKARSLKIQEVLQKLLQTFTSNLEEANKKESDAKALHDNLMGAKGGEKGAAINALDVMELETGARGMSREESVDEKDALDDQITNDKAFILQVQRSLDEKKREWKVRQSLRQAELAAISKAISILHGDDARDLFKRSYASQAKGSAFLFLQEGSSSSSGMRVANSAASILRAAGREGHDSRLLAVASGLIDQEPSHFTEVVEAIDTMLSLLQREEAKDLAKKEKCESDRAADTREAIKTSRTMDEYSDTITADKAKIVEITAEIEDKEKQVVSIWEELNETKRIRDDEEQEFLVDKKDDEDAAGLVKNAQGVLSDFYTENGLMLAQQKKNGQPFVGEAGKAPPPPPPTWDAPYGGKTDEQSGIIAIMGMIHEDILKDISKADAEEAAAVALYGKTKSALEQERSDLNEALISLKEAKGDKEQAVVDNTGERRTEKGNLEVVMDRIKGAEPGCAYFQINYPIRVTNRQIEVDGMLKAKSILTGGSFDAVDHNRELKPGDAAALVQGGKQQVIRKHLRSTIAALM